jgi:hypothetical protein
VKNKDINVVAKKKANKTGKFQNTIIDEQAEAYSDKMMLQKIKGIAKKMGINAGNLNKPKLIKAIQKAEGNQDCYSTPQVQTCGQIDCLWREDCLSS